MFCQYCGRSVQPSFLFCQNCGRPCAPQPQSGCADIPAADNAAGAAPADTAGTPNTAPTLPSAGAASAEASPTPAADSPTAGHTPARAAGADTAQTIYEIICRVPQPARSTVQYRRTGALQKRGTLYAADYIFFTVLYLLPLAGWFFGLSNCGRGCVNLSLRGYSRFVMTVKAVLTPALLYFLFSLLSSPAAGSGGAFF